MKPLRLMIADDHELVRQGLRNTLASQTGWTICAEAVNGREAVDFARRLKPDVAVLDITMPELNGLEAARQIHKTCPHTEVLILTMHEADELISEVLATGARGYILKTDTSKLLVTAIETLAQHKPFFTGKVSALVLDHFLNPTGKPLANADVPGGRLTTREREIVQLLAEDRTNKEVSVKLGISVKTVDAHRANLMHKLDLHSVTDIVRYAIRNKIIEA